MIYVVEGNPVEEILAFVKKRSEQPQLMHLDQKKNETKNLS
ncbi:MAG TPA: hypothetical protein VLK78_05910 [Candidatus Angelobacter sp.]|jgi:hypothetical protein|nr:hypothetical protein [Candidatus Angelobacter sp.]